MNICHSNKFQFLGVEETRSKFGAPTFAHIHVALGIEANRLQKFEDKMEVIKADISKLVAARGFDPNILIQAADRGIGDYLVKGTLDEAHAINTRATMKKRVTEPVSSEVAS